MVYISLYPDEFERTSQEFNTLEEAEAGLGRPVYRIFFFEKEEESWELLVEHLYASTTPKETKYIVALF
jgi:hypothetical protein